MHGTIFESNGLDSELGHESLDRWDLELVSCACLILLGRFTFLWYEHIYANRYVV